MGESRKTFLNALQLLVERVSDKPLLLLILDFVAEWIFDPTQSNMASGKEKCGLLMGLGEVGGEVQDSAVKLVVRIYDDERFSRSELTVRLQPMFLKGWITSSDSQIRDSFLRILHNILPPDPHSRLEYILGVQKWDGVADEWWLGGALFLLLATIDDRLLLPADFKVFPRLLSAYHHGASSSRFSRCSFLMPHAQIMPLTALDFVPDSKFAMLSDTPTPLLAARRAFLSQHRNFLTSTSSYSRPQFLSIIQRLCHAQAHLTMDLWTQLFPLLWKLASNESRKEICNLLILQLSHPHHLQNSLKRPNCIQALLQGAQLCSSPLVLLPPQMVKWLSKSFCVWHVGLEILRLQEDDELTDARFLSSASAASTTQPQAAIHNKQHASAPFNNEKEDVVRELGLDALVELYSSLAEDDLVVGVWRRHSFFPETNLGLSFEQSSMWQKAQEVYESAQLKARNGIVRFIFYLIGWMGCFGAFSLFLFFFK